MTSQSFPPIARFDARVLILGSLPGAESLRRQQYYAKTANAFWRLMQALVGASPDLTYDERCACLMERGIAVWDVCASARRPGSLDAKIDRASIVPNDFPRFFADHPCTGFIGFNGHAAADIFRVKVLPVLAGAAALPSAVLPSTSPAHAGLPLRRQGRILARGAHAVDRRLRAALIPHHDARACASTLPCRRSMGCTCAMAR